MPKEVRYQTRHEQCLEMLDEWGEQVPYGWVTGDDEFGRHSRFREELRERGERYALGVPLKRASNEASVKWEWTSTRSEPGRAGITTWRCP